MRDINMQPTCFTFICYFPGDFKHPFVLCSCSGPSVHKHLFKFWTCIFKTSVKTVSSSHSHNFHCLSSQIRSRTLVVFSELRARYEFRPPPPQFQPRVFFSGVTNHAFFFCVNCVTVLLKSIIYCIFFFYRKKTASPLENQENYRDIEILKLLVTF